MQYTLYTHPFSRGMYVVWALKECGADCQVKLVQFGGQMKSAEYLAVNPQGQVPALKVGDTVLTETLAILTFLAEQFPDKGLIPPAGSIERGEFYRWLCLSIHLEYALMDKFMQVSIDAETQKAIGYGNPDVLLDTLRNHLNGRTFILGNQFSVLDLYFSALIAHFTRNMPVLSADDSILQHYAAAHLARPAFAETMAWAEQAVKEMA
ncbi:glutathione S-transferase family protein [Lonepinella sp. MS14435]|uniref:glutathione S-transferase family protein n=1 Tax=Lonepinella sp. MS14435 TaxID=3003618 RepID=UPI0036DBE216